MSREVPRDEITLGVLAAVESDAAISQRMLSRELGVALGLANAYLKRCVRKGYIKIQQVPSRRYAYYLTPQGFAEKSRLTADYLASSLTFFRRARAQLEDIMADCAARGWTRVALMGASEIAEIATLTAHDHAVEIVGLVDSGLSRDRFCGLPVAKCLSDLGGADAVIMTQTLDMDAMLASLEGQIGRERVLVPRLVKLAHLNATAKRTRSAPAGLASRANTGK